MQATARADVLLLNVLATARVDVSVKGGRSCGLLAKAQARALVDVPAALLFCGTDQRVQHVCTSFHHENAWICARRTTDLDRVSVIPGKKEQRKREKVRNENMQSRNHSFLAAPKVCESISSVRIVPHFFPCEMFFELPNEFHL